MRRSLCFALVLLTLGAPVSRGQTIDVAKSYFDRGRASYANGELDRAIDDFSVAIMFDPAYAVAYYGRGNAKRANGDFLGAISDYSNAIEINSRYAMAYYNRARVWQERRDFNRAIADFTITIKLNPSFALTYANRGLIKLLQGRSEDAQRDFDQCLTLDDSLRRLLMERIKEVRRALGTR